MIRQSVLAQTLQHIINNGFDDFYHGALAQKLLKSVKHKGAIWEERDLTEYTVKIREPLIARIDKTTLVTAPPSSAGGIGILQA